MKLIINANKNGEKVRLTVYEGELDRSIRRLKENGYNVTSTKDKPEVGYENQKNSDMTIRKEEFDYPPGMSDLEKQAYRNSKQHAEDERVKVAKNKTSIEALAIGAGYTADQLWQGGRSLFSDREGKERIRKDMDEKDKAMELLGDEYPLATFVGETIPYFAPVGPFVKGAKWGIDALNGLTGSPLRSPTDKVKKFSNKYLLPRIRKAGKNTATVPIIGGAAIGAAEGLVHINDDPLSGMLFGGLFGWLGSKLNRGLARRKPPPTDPEFLKQLDWEIKEGFTISAGDRSLDPTTRAKESAIRNNANWLGFVQNDITVPNQKLINKITFGLLGENSDTLTRGMMERIKKRIGKKYNDVLEGTHVNIDVFRKEGGDIIDGLGDIPEEYRGLVTFQLNKIAKETGLEKIDGVWINKEISGEKFQNMDRSLRELINRTDDSMLRNKYKDVRAALNKSMKANMGESKLKKFIKANEEYAVANMVEESIDSSGNIRPETLDKILKKDNQSKYATGDYPEDSIFNTLSRVAKTSRLKSEAPTLSVVQQISNELTDWPDSFAGLHTKNLLTGFDYKLPYGFFSKRAIAAGVSIDSRHPAKVAIDQANTIYENIMGNVEKSGIFENMPWDPPKQEGDTSRSRGK